MKEITDILSLEIFRKIFNNNSVKLSQLKAAITLLVKFGIPFNFSFSPGTRRIAAQASLTIYINPSTKLEFIITFEPGEIVL